MWCLNMCCGMGIYEKMCNPDYFALNLNEWPYILCTETLHLIIVRLSVIQIFIYDRMYLKVNVKNVDAVPVLRTLT